MPEFLILCWVLVGGKMEASYGLIRVKTSIHEKIHFSYTFSTSSMTGQVYVKTGCQWMTKGRKETCGSLWRLGMGSLGKRRRNSIQIKVQRLNKSLAVGGSSARFGSLLTGALVYVEELCCWEWKYFINGLEIQGESLGMVGFVVGSPDSWLLCHMI